MVRSQTATTLISAVCMERVSIHAGLAVNQFRSVARDAHWQTEAVRATGWLPAAVSRFLQSGGFHVRDVYA